MQEMTVNAKNVVQKATTFSILEEAGIMPTFFAEEVEPHLAKLSPEEARKLRRKFRKVWREVVRKNWSATFCANVGIYGEPGKDPTSAQKAARRRLVFNDAQRQMNELLSTDRKLRF